MNSEVKAYMESLKFIYIRSNNTPPQWLRVSTKEHPQMVISPLEAEFFYNAQKGAIRKVLDRVDKEVIGEDVGITSHVTRYDLPSVDPTKSYRNELRSEQRQKLDSIIKDLDNTQPVKEMPIFEGTLEALDNLTIKKEGE